MIYLYLQGLNFSTYDLAPKLEAESLFVAIHRSYRRCHRKVEIRSFKTIGHTTIFLASRISRSRPVNMTSRIRYTRISSGVRYESRDDEIIYHLTRVRNDGKARFSNRAHFVDLLWSVVHAVGRLIGVHVQPVELMSNVTGHLTSYSSTKIFFHKSTTLFFWRVEICVCCEKRYVDNPFFFVLSVL